MKEWNPESCIRQQYLVAIRWIIYRYEIQTSTGGFRYFMFWYFYQLYEFEISNMIEKYREKTGESDV